MIVEQIRRIVVDSVDFTLYKKILSGRVGGIELYHSRTPVQFPCFAITDLMESGMDVPWWDHTFISRAEINKDMKVLDLMTDAEVAEFNSTVLKNFMGKNSMHHAQEAPLSQEEREWNAWWNRLDELKERQSKPESTAPAPHAYPMTSISPRDVKFLEEEIHGKQDYD